MSSRRWGLFGALGGELTVLGILLMIPLAWTDRLPHADRRGPVLMGPPPAARPALHAEGRSSGRSSKLPQIIFRVDPLRSNGNPVQHVEFDPPGDPVGVTGGVEWSANILTPVIPAMKLPPPPEKPRVEEPKPLPPKSVAVSKGAQLAKLIHQVKPVYPIVAKMARVSGTVQLVGVISKDGTIRNLQVLSGHPLLVRAALEAVSQWIYRPTTLSGEPVEVTAPIEVNFILTQ